MPFRSLPVRLFVALLLFTLAASADTITLKSGEKIEGRVVKETEADYTIEYKVSAGITDSRTVLKSEVDKVDKVPPDELAYQSLKNVKPGPNSLNKASYEATIKALQGFLDQFPKSAHAGEIVQNLTAFVEEKNRVDGGELKIDGKWISQADAEKERYQITARAVFAQMQEEARRGDVIGALNLFDQLEMNYPGSTVYPDAVAVDEQLLTKVKAMAEQALAGWKIQQKQREADTQLMSEPTRGETIAAQTREQQQYDAALDALQKSGAKWPPLVRHEKTLTTIGSKAQTELNRIEKLPVAKMRQSIQVAQQARAKLAEHDEDGAVADLRQATTLWSANEVASRLQKEISAEHAAAAKATPAPTPAATPEPAVAKATPRPTAPPTGASAPPRQASEEPKSFFSTGPGLGVAALVLIGLGIGFLAYQKKKRAAAQQFE